MLILTVLGAHQFGDQCNGRNSFSPLPWFFKNSSYTTLTNRSWNSNSVYFLNVYQNWMSVVMRSLNLPFLYRVIIFISEAVILKYSSHLVLTLPSATFLIQGMQKQWCLLSGKTIIKVRRQMIYCKWRNRCTHLYSSHRFLSEFTIPHVFFIPPCPLSHCIVV